MAWAGLVEDVAVSEILLNMGCSKTTVHRDLVPEDRQCQDKL